MRTKLSRFLLATTMVCAGALALVSANANEAAVKGVCGYANNTILAEAPTTQSVPSTPTRYASRNLCFSGVASDVAGMTQQAAYTWTWSCAGSGGGA
ncbi:MAG: hypothetical protein WAK01_16520, partial [Methylocystis sp.]